MSRTQILFSNCSVATQTGKATKYFEAITDEYPSEPVKTEEAEKRRKRFFADASHRKDKLIPTFEEELRSAPLFPAARENRQELSHTLLFYLDQIVYLEEISENLARLDAAIKSENAVEVNSIANTCAGMSVNCGMFAALKPLRELERVEQKNQMLKAERLSLQVGKEFERFKLTLKENLESITNYELRIKN